MKYVVSLNGKNYEVEVEKGEATIIKTENTPLVESKVVENTKPVETLVKKQENSNNEVVDGTLVKAPMPGTILDIKVNIGDKVKKGDILLILEAMKMENEVTSLNDGVVAQILAVKGSSVATDDNLIVVQ